MFWNECFWFANSCLQSAVVCSMVILIVLAWNIWRQKQSIFVVHPQNKNSSVLDKCFVIFCSWPVCLCYYSAFSPNPYLHYALLLIQSSKLKSMECTVYVYWNHNMDFISPDWIFACLFVVVIFIASCKKHAQNNDKHYHWEQS